jgi:hypothetical protein
VPGVGPKTVVVVVERIVRVRIGLRVELVVGSGDLKISLPDSSFLFSVSKSRKRWLWPVKQMVSG